MKRTKYAFLIVPIIFTLFALNISGTHLEEPESAEGLDYISASSVSSAGELRSYDITQNDQSENDSPGDSAFVDQTQAVVPNDPYLEEQWAFDQIQIAKVWSITTGSPTVLVAVLDTGIDVKHPDLENNVVSEINFTNSPTPDDLHGHGTHIAGTIAACSNNTMGISGMAPDTKLMNVKVADDQGRCDITALTCGIIWAVNNGADIINISIQIADPSSSLQQAVDYAWENGVIVIAAAGNSASDLPTYPAAYSNCVAVAAIKPDNTLAPLSNYGNWIDVAAPGFSIFSTLPNDNYGYKTGTSFAAAHVSGLAALLFTIVMDADGDGKLNDEVRDVIETSCQNIGLDGVGQGLINAANTLTMISQG